MVFTACTWHFVLRRGTALRGLRAREGQPLCCCALYIGGSGGLLQKTLDHLRSHVQVKLYDWNQLPPLLVVLVRHSWLVSSKGRWDSGKRDEMSPPLPPLNQAMTPTHSQAVIRITAQPIFASWFLYSIELPHECSANKRNVIWMIKSWGFTLIVLCANSAVNQHAKAKPVTVYQ